MLTPLFEQLAASWPEVLPQPPTARQTEQVGQYTALLVEWNQRMNLTAIKEPEGIIVKHFMDSLSVLAALDPVASDGFRLIDVGTGAGFPGAALAILRPTWRVTLLEATRKKVEFLDAVVQALGLENVTTLRGRAEEQGQEPSQRERYDAAVARAVAELAVLAEYCLPFVRVGGHWVAQKGPKVEEEVSASRNALGQLGGKLLRVQPLAVPGMTEETRNLVIVQKVKATPVTFPRRPGTPSKRPL